MKHHVVHGCARLIRVGCSLLGIIMLLSTISATLSLHSEGVFYQIGYAIAGIAISFMLASFGLCFSYLVEKELSRDEDRFLLN